MVAFDPKKFTPEEIAKGRRAVYILNTVMAVFIVLPFVVWLVKKEVSGQSDAKLAPAPARMELRLVSRLPGNTPDGQIPAGYERLTMRAHPDGDPAKSVDFLLIVKKAPEADAEIFESAYLHLPAPSQPTQDKGFSGLRSQSEEVAIGYGITALLTKEGRARLAQITRQIAESNPMTGPPGQLAFVFEGHVYYAPAIQTMIDTPRIEISGNFTRAEAETLLHLLTAHKPSGHYSQP